MSAPYNLTPLLQADDLGAITASVDTVTGGYMVNGILLAIFVISFIAMKNYDTKTALSASIFGTAMLAIIMNTFLPVSSFAITVLVVGVAIVGVLQVFGDGFGV
jgi:hypothetical protein